MKLNQKELEQFVTRKNLIIEAEQELQKKTTILQIIKREAKYYNNKLLKDRGLDINNLYDIAKDGTITEVKNAKVQPKKAKSTKVDTKDKKKPTPDKGSRWNTKPA